MKESNRCSLLLLVALLALGCAACATTRRTAWDPKAVSKIEGLAERIRVGGIPCETLEFGDFRLFASDYEGRLPLPAALASCVSADAEDITFEVFDTKKQVGEFLAAKHDILCKATNKRKAKEVPEYPVFPGFPHVIGDTWIIEPDRFETLQAVAKILGGEARQIPCVYVAPVEN